MELALEDHFGASRSLVELAGRVVVLVYAERSGASAALSLGRSLHERFIAAAGDPAVSVIPVACLAEVPSFFHGMARSMLRRESPHVVVWIDFNGALQRAVGLTPNVANVAIVDPHGRLGGVHAGDFAQPFLEAVAADIERCRRGTEIAPCPRGSG